MPRKLNCRFRPCAREFSGKNGCKFKQYPGDQAFHLKYSSFLRAIKKLSDAKFAVMSFVNKLLKNLGKYQDMFAHLVGTEAAMVVGWVNLSCGH